MRAPSLGRGCRAQRGGVGFLFCGEAASSLPSPLGKGDRAAVDRALSYIVDLRCISPLIFHTARTLSGSLRSPPSPRGEGFVSGIALSSFRCLPHWGRGTASAVDRVLSYIVDLRRISSLSFIPLVPYPPLRGTFPSRGRLCPSLFFPHMCVFVLTM